MNHPLCERCQSKGKITPAIDIHHRISFMTVEDDLLKMKAIAFDYDNLESLCKECHQKEHNQKYFT
jgi:5-methylcytosine-specific restriction protein A